MQSDVFPWEKKKLEKYTTAFNITEVGNLYFFINYCMKAFFLAHGWRSHAMGFWRHSNGTRSLTHSLTHSLDSN